MTTIESDLADREAFGKLCERVNTLSPILDPEQQRLAQIERNNQLIAKEQREQLERGIRQTRKERRDNLWAAYGELTTALKAWGKVAGQSSDPKDSASGLVLPVREAFEKWIAVVNI